MSQESDLGGPVYVSDGDVKVEKSFVAEEFPVPAIKFRISSDSEEAVHVRIVDSIPKDFPMEGVGFHPDYESENWTAYKDQRVEYERTLEPEESVTTVYGIRLNTVNEASSFLVEPVLERPPVPAEGEEADHADDGVEDILGEDRSQLVRDALQGNGSLADEGALDEDAEPEADAAESEPIEDADDAGADADAETNADADSDASGGSAIEEAEDAVEKALESIPNPADEDGEDDAAAEDADDAAEAETAEPREIADDSTPAVVDSPAGPNDDDVAAAIGSSGVEADAGDAGAETSADADAETDEDDAEEPAADAGAREYVEVEGAVSDADAEVSADAGGTTPTRVRLRRSRGRWRRRSRRRFATGASPRRTSTCFGRNSTWAFRRAPTCASVACSRRWGT
ncbi:hypothetical protein [Halopelagius fulvigenes]|uniref:Uncharacterized protein n=1 Tax=Halopelagius fulvigenes TaxID=1198324 RepID=A0ABD5TYC2_9EURY